MPATKRLTCPSPSVRLPKQLARSTSCSRLAQVIQQRRSLRLASGPAQPATHHPASGPSVYETGPPSTPIPAQSGCPSSSAQAGQALTSCSRLAPSHPRSLRLVSKYASLRLAAGPVPQPACWRVLRVPSQQLATQPQAQVCMKQALPIQQPGPVPGDPNQQPTSAQPAQPRPRRISGHASH